MLSEHQLELLTGFVDGELTSAEHQAALGLVESSSEARAILKDLQEVARQVRELPHRTLGNEFAAQVLQALAEKGRGTVKRAEPARERSEAVARRAATCRRRFSWTFYAAAACVFVAVAVGVFVATRSQRPQDPLLAELKRLPDPTKNQPRAFPLPEAVPPLRLTFADLSQQQQQAVLAERLAKESAVRLDISVRDQAQAVRQLADALQAKGIKVLIDPRIQASLKKPGKSNVEYSVYTAGVGATELAAVLRQLAEGPKKSPPGTLFQSLVVRPLSKDDRQQIAGRLGIDISALAPQAGGGERCALVWASGGGVLPAAEINAFLGGKREQRPGSVQVLLVIRQA